MFSCIVEMYGISPGITDQTRAEVQITEGAGIKELIDALKAKIPSLEGQVIQSGSSRLTESYALIINGQFYMGDNEVKLQKGDRVVLVMLATGG